MNIPSERDLLQAACHIGHKKEKWNPKMDQYIYGVQKSIHIFNLVKTREHLEKACEALKKLHTEGKTILFVSTKQQSIQILEEIAEDLGQPYVTKKWIPGLVTNWNTIKKRLKYYLDLQNSFKTGEVEKYTKKEQLQLRKKLAKLDTALSGVANLAGVPDAIFVVDAVRDNVAVKEARKLNIPLYGICDSNADPTDFTELIPANDDALKCITLVLRTIQSALTEGKGHKKKEEAKDLPTSVEPTDVKAPEPVLESTDIAH